MTTVVSVSELNILDTFPEFEMYWRKYKDVTIETQIEAWASEYMQSWPHLFAKLTKQYKSEGEEWKKVAKERVFPYLGTNLLKIRRARKALLSESKKTIRNVQRRAKSSFPIDIIIYVGIGLGAGWATSYLGRPALLFGLENIAEEGWTDKSEVIGLVRHELGHLFHSFWRERAGKRFGSGPLWDLYTEGFADRFENSAQSDRKTHMSKDDEGEEWLEWCRNNRQWLASEFLTRLNKKGDMRMFFGSWYQIHGYGQTGYFIGSELVKQLEKQYSLKQIAVLDNISRRFKQLVNNMASGSI
jgi:hypothetical protein